MVSLLFFQPNFHSKVQTMKLGLLILFVSSLLITTVECGCAELRLCCPGRNMSCIALDTGRPRVNAVLPEGVERNPNGEVTSAEARRRGGRIGGSWHVHLDRGTSMENFGGSLDGGDRFFESLLASSSALGDRAGGDGENGAEKSENVRLPKEDYDDLSTTSSSKSSLTSPGDQIDGSADGEYGSGDEPFSSVDWLKSASKEKSSKEQLTTDDPQPEKKIDHYKIAEDDQYQVLNADHKEFGANEQLMIRYVIESDEIPVTIEQLEMLQNYRSLLGGADRSCYCDEACRVLGDCCGDYTTVCPVIDCLATDWSDWTPCEASADHQKYVATNDHQNHCGLGISRRQRRVIRQAVHGGKPCPILEEQRTCFSTETQSCNKQRVSEVAQLVPYEYGRARVPGYKNNSAGIFYDLPKDIAKFNAGKTHCVTFEITWLNPACSDDEIRSQLQVGRRVCAECQVTAQTIEGNRCVGEGAEGQQSTWNMVNGAKHCHGFWKPLREEKQGEECLCEIQFQNDARYLFV